VAHEATAAGNATATASTHTVHFYETSEHLAWLVNEFISSGVNGGECVILVASRARLDAMSAYMRSHGLPVRELLESKQIVVVNADELLSSLVVNGSLDRARFFDTAPALVDSCLSRWPGVRLYGEMVTMLWREGKCGYLSSALIEP
jgi:hypothetical protein